MKASQLLPAFFTLLCTCSALPATENSLSARSVPTALCIDTYCISEKHAVYNTTSMKCECQWIDTSCPDLFCISEKIPVFNPTTGTCACQWIPGLEPSSISTLKPTPTPTPKIPKPKPICTDIVCISEMHPVYNATFGHCECEWIPGFGPVKRALPTPTLTKGCPGLFCISEQHPVYNATSGHCECEWIPGFGPVGSK